MKICKIFVLLAVMLVFVSSSYSASAMKLALDVSLKFSLVNSVPVVSSPVVLGNSCDVSVQYSLVDADHDLCRVYIQYRGGYKGDVWQNITYTGYAVGHEPDNNSGINVDVVPNGSRTISWNSFADLPNAIPSESYFIRIAAVDAVHSLSGVTWSEYGPFSLDNTECGGIPPEVIVPFKISSVDAVVDSGSPNPLALPLVRLWWDDDPGVVAYKLYWWNDQIPVPAWDEVDGDALNLVGVSGSKHYWVDNGTDPQMNGLSSNNFTVKKRFYTLKAIKR